MWLGSVLDLVQHCAGRPGWLFAPQTRAWLAPSLCLIKKKDITWTWHTVYLMSVVHKLPTICYSYLKKEKKSGFLCLSYELFVSGLANIAGVTYVISSIWWSKNLNIPIVFQFLCNMFYLIISIFFLILLVLFIV